ncbi:hypothetical protein BCR33DRAFT_711918 [Rhizoclosmatium globosum]|uniref:F-box domain-containing protein n=1 Tax=Rhizoclosmatium globosum TaxID=329046 RepID=A0A1Y2D045_9FUNG|nr:hypothetical protein BCR33DRAFT_711918 [Rhizoclosmatium globosum]|eukprot:ORY52669.1 hypothetical protein BCR33DRAFT_711918 [Rhizoclosmatium globosum]
MLFHQLPPELTTKVVVHVDAATLRNLSLTSRAVRAFVASLPLSFWKSRIKIAGTRTSFVDADPRSLLTFVAVPGEPLDKAPHILVRDINLVSAAQSISVWLRCSPPISSGGYTGGVVIGCQSDGIMSQDWPHYHWQIIMVDPEGHLRASFDSDGHCHIIGPNVNDGNWHHIALVANNKSQVLYVDAVSHGVCHTDLQLGNGVISGDTDGKPTNEWCGAFPFTGSVSHYRSIPRALNKYDVETIFLKEGFYMNMDDNELVNLAWALHLMELGEAGRELHRNYYDSEDYSEDGSEDYSEDGSEDNSEDGSEDNSEDGSGDKSEDLLT